MNYADNPTVKNQAANRKWLETNSVGWENQRRHNVKKIRLKDNKKLSMTEREPQCHGSMFCLFFAGYGMVTNSLCCSNLYYY